ncbi:hypothetical protein C4K05_3613 [Pseudomonas chlororaphis subsp. aureofaciens]|uniref:Uncharacterized protein n=1 Tax=Pseudomonas chlororaphis subsp. aureofaciens TaxID=587851 RepID=A0AAD1E7V3_9PSED|nr:hypothetical protein [Pseudomonas chlororaphis]AZE30319.1 hypothetical protein C4K07_3535 [Pseudomonas chlororaphis subsp. aureofaciens]AZE42952.1 hypothetical protein C4K05_3613 [Pseudomonas chlororaphis subsp. aureofaciens]
MSSTDFFKKPDQQIESARDNKIAAEHISKTNLDYLAEIILRIKPVAEGYASELKQREIMVDLKSSKHSITFSMKYKDGGHHSLTLGSSHSDNRIEITGNYTNDDGRPYSSTDGKSYDQTNWSDDIYKEKLEKCIEDFIFYASRHGGI